VAQRIDLNYFKRPTPFKRARLILVILAPLLAIGWIAWRGFSRDSRVYSSGRMSGPHAVLEKQCAVCHVQKIGEFAEKAADNGVPLLSRRPDAPRKPGPAPMSPPAQPATSNTADASTSSPPATSVALNATRI